MTPEEIRQKYFPLYDRFANMERLTKDPPHLAHYTSISVMQQILENEEIWFSNPLFMNDTEEMRFGLDEGARLFAEPEFLKSAAGSEGRALKLEKAFAYFHEKFRSDLSFDTYVFCLSEHEKTDTDGLLSMWRGYGGQGKGAALVFDTGAVTLVPGSPLILTEVSYADGPRRVAELENILFDWRKITISAGFSDDELVHAAYFAFSVILTYALITKHNGFSEEREWRIIYIAENDRQKLLGEFLHYSITDRGIEPKLKYKVGAIANVSAPDLAIGKILAKIILGPSIATPFALKAGQRMLEKMKKPHYIPRLHASKIPFRSTEAR